MRFARLVFWIAGVYGIVMVAPLYVLEARVGHDYAPPVTHPEFYYGFAGVTLAWQLVFLIIGSNPNRYRPIMLAAVVEKLAYSIAIFGLAIQNRIAAPIAITGIPDFLLAILFAMAWLRSRSPSAG
ncbi:MAG TPA: hypothetical protein VLT57_11115 [Bryobacteraceae bacterium]|nr:hypothetical protein [Bryobacteraceae bacterium]